MNDAVKDISPEWANLAREETARQLAYESVMATLESAQSRVLADVRSRWLGVIPWFPFGKKEPPESDVSDVALPEIRRQVTLARARLRQAEEQRHRALHGWLLENDSEYLRIVEPDACLARLIASAEALRQSVSALWAQYGRSRREFAAAPAQREKVFRTTLLREAFGGFAELPVQQSVLMEELARARTLLPEAARWIQVGDYSPVVVPVFEELMPYSEVAARLQAGGDSARITLEQLVAVKQAAERRLVVVETDMAHHRARVWRNFIEFGIPSATYRGHDVDA